MGWIFLFWGMVNESISIILPYGMSELLSKYWHINFVYTFLFMASSSMPSEGSNASIFVKPNLAN